MSRRAHRIRALRESRGLAEDALARDLDLTVEALGDLESYDHELDNAVSFAQLLGLSHSLSISPRDLIDSDSSVWPPAVRSWAELANLVRMYLDANSESLEALEERVGWSLGCFLGNNDDALARYPLDFLRDLAESLDLDWREFVPNEGRRLTRHCS